MGTHPIFESDFDCLTGNRLLIMASNNEVELAKLAAEAQKRREGQEATLFDKIIAKEIPADVIYEDEASLAFRDINAQAPTHFLVIPKARIPMLSKATDDDSQLLGHLLTVARKVADQEKLEKGYRIVINNGEHGAQSVSTFTFTFWVVINSPGPRDNIT